MRRTTIAGALVAAALAVIVVSVFASDAIAGAWTQPPGFFYVKGSYSYSWADEQIKCCVDEHQPILSPTDLGDVREQAIRLYTEYGLPFEIPGGLTVLGAFEYKLIDLDTERALRHSQGFTDVRLGLKWGLPIRAILPVVFALQVDTKIPTGYEANLLEGQGIPWLGNGVFEFTSSFLVGASFYPAPVYMTGGVGFRWRGQAEVQGNLDETVDYANEIPYNLEAGVTIADRVLIRAYFDGIAPLGDVAELDIVALTPPSSRSFRLAGGVTVFIWEGLQVNVDYRRVLTGTNVVLFNELEFGLAWAS